MTIISNEQTDANGDKYWCETDSNGTVRWYLNDKFHREDGPAIERVSGEKWWCLNGERHRTDGPAIENANRCSS